MAQSSAPTGAADPLAAITFRSIVPTVNSLLATLQQQSTADVPPSAVEASEQVARKARELAGALAEMRNAAINLPEGHLSIDQINQMCDFLGQEAEKRKAVLHAFGSSRMSVVDSIGVNGTEEVNGNTSVLPSPAAPGTTS